MRRVLLPTLLTLAVLLPDPAAAQLRFQAGGGLSRPSGDFGDVVDSGYQGRVGLELGFPLFPVSIRAEGEASRFPAAELSDGHATLLGGSLSAVLTLGGIGVSPYLVAGVGRYRLGYSDDFGVSDATTGTGYHGGVGLELGLLGLGGFVEARFLSVSQDVGNLRTIPITLGLRF